MTVENAGERKLLYWLGIFNEELSKSCVGKARRCIDCQQIGQDIKPEIVTSRRTGRPIAFRIQLRTPYYFGLSRSLSRFDREENYRIGGEETLFFATLGFVRAFMLNLDRVTLIKSWGDMARKIFASSADLFADEESVIWKLLPGVGRASELSSMNFVLRQNGVFQTYEAVYKDILKDYFTYAFWAFPRKGFSDSTVIIHNDQMVRSVLKSSKSLYIPGKPVWVNMDVGPEKGVEVKTVPLLELVRTKAGYDLIGPERVVLTRGIADSLDAEQARGKVIINGVVDELVRRSLQYRLLTEVELYEVSNCELIMSLIGIIATNRFYNGGSFSRIGDLKEIRTETMSLLELLLRRSPLGKTMGDSLNQFDTALNQLRPIITVNKGDVLYMHPSVFIALLENGYNNLLSKEEALASVLRLLDVVYNENLASALQSEESASLRKSNCFPDRVIQALRPALEQMCLARILKNPPVRINEESTNEENTKSEPIRTSSRPSALRQSNDRNDLIGIATKSQMKFLRKLQEKDRKLHNVEKDSY